VPLTQLEKLIAQRSQDTHQCQGETTTDKDKWGYPQPDNCNAACCSHDTNFAQKQHECSNTIDSNHAQDIARQNTKCLSQLPTQTVAYETEKNISCICSNHNRTDHNFH